MSAVMARLDPDERDQLARLLDKLLEEVAEAPVTGAGPSGRSEDRWS
ncbi:hypothetical protein BH24ACT8_BH24ACT8_06910 [soil metagenome]